MTPMFCPLPPNAPCAEFKGNATTAFVDGNSGGRGRLDLGFRHTSNHGLSTSAGAFLDGIGDPQGKRTHGVQFRMQLNF